MKSSPAKNTRTALVAAPQPSNPALKKPSQEEIEEHLIRFVDQDISCFNCDLQLARMIYRSNPELVRAKRYPEPWRGFFLKELGYAPSDTDARKAPTIQQLRKQLLPEAIEHATNSANQAPEAPEGEREKARRVEEDRFEAMRMDALNDVHRKLEMFGEKGPFGTFIPLVDALLLQDIVSRIATRGLMGAINEVVGRYLSAPAA